MIAIILLGFIAVIGLALLVSLLRTGFPLLGLAVLIGAFVLLLQAFGH
jgi:hypothetical protein